MSELWFIELGGYKAVVKDSQSKTSQIKTRK